MSAPASMIGVADLAHDVGPREVQEVVVALLVVREVAAGAEAGLVEPVALDRGAVGPVLHQDALLGDLAQEVGFLSAGHAIPGGGRTPSRWQIAKVEVGAVQRVEMELVDAFGLQAAAQVARDGGGDHAACLDVVVEAVEHVGQPGRHLGAAQAGHPASLPWKFETGMMPGTIGTLMPAAAAADRGSAGNRRPRRRTG